MSAGRRDECLRKLAGVSWEHLFDTKIELVHSKIFVVMIVDGPSTGFVCRHSDVQ